MNKLGTELKRQRTKIERIKADTLSEFAKDKTDTTKEIINRFEHQDRTILSISHFILWIGIGSLWWKLLNLW